MYRRLPMQKKSTITLFVFSLILAWSLVGFSFYPFAVVFDNFDDNSIDNTKWLVSVVGDKPSIVEENKRLEITLPADSTNATGQTYFSAGYISTCQLTGDFDLQVDYSLLDWPPNNGVRIGIVLNDNYAIPKEYNVERISFGNSDFLGFPREVYLYGNGNGITATSHLSGTMRIKRATAVLTAYFMGDGNWVTLGSEPITTEDLHFSVSAWSHSYAFANQNVKVAFDDITILQGALVCPNLDTATPTRTPTPINQSTPTLLPTPTTASTPTDTQPATSTATRSPIMPTASETISTTVTPGSVYLPMVSKFDTPTPTETTIPPTATPTKTPTNSGGDTKPPGLVTWTFAPKSVDTSMSDQTIIFTAHITDDLSGLASPGYGIAWFDGPSGQITSLFFLYPRDLISGTAQDGIYQSALTLPRFTATGIWKVRYIEMVDRVRNKALLYPDKLSARGLPVSFEVTNNNN